MSKLLARDILESGPNDQQPRSSDDTIQSRRLRTRQSARHEASKEPTSQSGTGSLKPESSRPHMGASRMRSSAMSRSHHRRESFSLGPRLTKTGRISKAKKGVKDAHICDQCGKKYSRAEHLRRHEQNHEPSKLSCTWPDCGKVFSRQDLLERHETKHRENRHMSDSGSARSSRSSSIRKSSIHSNRSGIAAPEPTPTSFSHDVPVVTLAEQYAMQEDAIAPALSQSASATFPSKHTAAPGVRSIQFPLVSIFDDASLVTSEYGALDFIDGTQPSSGALSPTPWNPIPTFPPSIYAEPLVPLAPPSLDPWSTLASDSISPPASVTPGFWMEPPGASGTGPTFTSSLVSSPSPMHAIPATLLSPDLSGQTSDSIPYPLPWSGYRDGYGSLDIEGALEQQQLGETLNLKTKQHYVQAYWKHFHPLFPVLHPQTYQQHRSSPLLSAAVMAVGAQYTEKPFAKSDSRILHLKCQELIAKYKDTIKTTGRLDLLQAVFLVELLSHFKAKRASSSLSEAFRAVYNQLWDRHNNLHPQSVPRSELDRLSTVSSETNEGTLNHQWLQWITSHSYERLLVACYILESYEGLLMIRPSPDLNRTAAGVGLDLYLPVNHEIWDARSPSQWQTLITSAGDLDSCLTKDVMQALDDIAHGVQIIRMDAFQSSLLVAVQASALLSQAQSISPYSTFTHTVFAPENISLFENSLSLSPYVRLVHEAVQLSACAPFKALLATSGESWLMSQKLSTEARAAKETFELLKQELRLWTNALQLPIPTLYSTTTGSSISAQVPFTAADVPAKRALRHALRILSLAMDVYPGLPSFGPEMALYYASLILWSCTYSAVHVAPEPNTRHASITSIASSAASDSGVSDISPEAAEAAGRHFLELADTHVSESELSGSAVPPLDALESWKVGVGAILRWTGWVQNGGLNGAGAGVGELANGAVGVLERLGRKGWVEGWF